jgi:predicted membrane protein
MIAISESRRDGRGIFGSIVIVLGLLLLLGNIYPEANIWSFIGKLWPAVLILLGVYIIFNRQRMKSRVLISTAAHNSLLGDLRIDYEGKELGNINVSHVVGDLTVDLTKSRLKPGINNIYISAVVGDSQIIIPAQFPLKISAKILVGDIIFDRRREEGLFPKLEHTDENFELSIDKLVVSINGVIGDMSIIRV